ncbi:MAG: phosphoglycerate mutase [Candidatus Omnitrophota bacterium]|nr:2,3-bisphosphoglycerate-independent phosphoglycerate mutase [Candidatus Omnitrophota bacterium]RKY33539.1 MAG: phosphoglycerate mutase [Candidatus Omnitrophota bacterium]RKY45513.1 MAG: phosphoglycerate mutase [Candidatus Omnitrophota bacterium]HDN85895.1 2,3-bisphosphoglycerate-independent phosphoglycerate mutase [Candidatus Omnitrophota bacterium]
MKKIFYIVLDGVGDLPISELQDKTPLESASTPCMDYLAKEGMQGVIYPVDKGVAPESDIAVISLLGYDAQKTYTGRGPLEAYASGVKIDDGDLGLRVNFATVEITSRKILDRRVGRSLSSEEAKSLAEEINQKVKLEDAEFIFKSTVGHRGILVIKRNKDLSGFITNTDPAYGREGVFGVALEKFSPYLTSAKPMPGYEEDKGAQLAAKLVNEFTEKSMKVLENSSINIERRKKGLLPANVILSRDAGSSLPKFKPIEELTSLKFACFVQMPVEKGIALLCGMDVVDVPLPSGDLKNDYTLWANLASENIQKFDALYIHIKGPDEPAHDGDFLKKKEIIELIDKYFFKTLLDRIDKNTCIICVTGDHSTPCQLKAHSADPVPVLVYGKEKDSTVSFGETEAKKGALGQFLGKELIYKLTEFAK